MASRYLDNEFQQYFNEMNNIWKNKFILNIDGESERDWNRNIALVKAFYKDGNYLGTRQYINHTCGNWIKDLYKRKKDNDYSSSFPIESIITMKDNVEKLEGVLNKQIEFKKIENKINNHYGFISFKTQK